MLLSDVIVQKAEEVVAFAESAGVTIASAESCTGGLVGGALTSVPGSSSVFLGGVISYSNEVKQNLLHVAPKILQECGAVSPECATEMAKGARRLLNADIAVSITGIAGPDGGTFQKPVGTVWFGISVSGKTGTKLCTFNGDRDSVRANSVLQALELLNATIRAAH